MNKEGITGCKTIFDVPPAYLTSMVPKKLKHTCCKSYPRKDSLATSPLSKIEYQKVGIFFVFSCKKIVSTQI
jgi:hypothetical protein